MRRRVVAAPAAAAPDLRHRRRLPDGKATTRKTPAGGRGPKLAQWLALADCFAAAQHTAPQALGPCSAPRPGWPALPHAMTPRPAATAASPPAAVPAICSSDFALSTAACDLRFQAAAAPPLLPDGGGGTGSGFTESSLLRVVASPSRRFSGPAGKPSARPPAVPAGRAAGCCHTRPPAGMAAGAPSRSSLGSPDTWFG
jgi:hypothetical protein